MDVNFYFDSDTGVGLEAADVTVKLNLLGWQIFGLEEKKTVDAFSLPHTNILTGSISRFVEQLKTPR